MSVPSSDNARCTDPKERTATPSASATGSPSWSRQAPPVIHEDLAIYASGSGKYAAQGTEKPFVMKGTPKPARDGREVMSWVYTHNNTYYPKDNKPLIWAWRLDTGRQPQREQRPRRDKAAGEHPQQRDRENGKPDQPPLARPSP